MNFIRDVKIFHGFNIFLTILFYILHTGSSIPQQPEINDQYENSTQIDEIVTINDTIVYNEPNINESRQNEITEPKEEGFIMKIYNLITKPINKIISIPKINSVLRNIGTCIVNGAMELITYYFPPPLIPLIATAAGMIIPFEPVVLLRQKMPVTSYRRAFRTALDGFLNTFDRYKVEDEDDDPYMTRRFNRRLMDHSGENNKIEN